MSVLKIRSSLQNQNLLNVEALEDRGQEDRKRGQDRKRGDRKRGQVQLIKFERKLDLSLLTPC